MTFPTDPITLALLDGACQINPSTGRSHLNDFLHVRAEVAYEEPWGDDGDVEVTHMPGCEPWSINQIIRALIAEIASLRQALQEEQP